MLRHAVISLLLLCAFTHISANITAVLGTTWFIFIIVRYGLKGAIAFTIAMGFFMVWQVFIRPNYEPSMAAVGIVTYTIMSFGIGIPIDSMRKKQAVRFASEERLFRITDNIQDIIIQIDKDAVIRYISPSCYKNFGRKQDYYLGKSLYDDVHPDDREKVEKAITESLLSRQFKLIEYRCMHENGCYVWRESLGEVIADNNGDPCEIVISSRDITTRKDKEEEIKYLSFHDTLTGLYNRRYFDNKLNDFIEQELLPLSIIIGDVNGLKLTNDVFGHLEGDKLLIQIADVLKKACRSEDIAARWGGDEFAVLLPNTNEKAAKQVVNSINNNCKSYSNELVKLSMALGTATRNSKTEAIETTIKEAEEKMYRHKLLESRSVRSNIISSLQKTLFEKSHETKEHAVRIMNMAERLGEEIGLSENEIDTLRVSALLHDIGKIGISDSVLEKPGILTEEEWQEMKKHPEIGHRIALSTQELNHIADYILSHHERWDGKGYPQGLKGEEIPKLARILAIVDAYDVMTHERPHKEAMSTGEAVLEIKRYAGIQFDPELADVFVKMLER